MAPICDNKTHVLKSTHCELEHEAEKDPSTSPPLKEKTNNTITSDQTKKLAYDNNDEVKSLKTKEPLSDENNGEKHTASRALSSSQSKKDDPKGSKLKDIDICIDKMKQEIEEQLHRGQFELQHLDEDEEETDSHSDIKATPKVEIPSELESAHGNKENVQGITKFSEDGKSTSKEDDSDSEDDEDNPPAEAANEITAPEEANVPVVQAQSKCTNREDSDVPIEKATECASSVGKAKFVIGVVSATETQVKGQVEPTYYLPVVEGKNSELLPDHTLTDLVSLNATSVSPNNNLLDDLPKEELTLSVNNSTELVVNQPSKHPEDEMETGSLTGATTFLTVENVEKLQTNTSTMYPYFPALTGSAGELTPMESSYDSSELHTQDDDENEVMTLEGSVSDHTSFKSGSADAFDPDV